MITRPLGRTGLEVSPLGFGAFKIGRNQGAKYERAYELPDQTQVCLLYTSPSPRDGLLSRMPSSA